MIRQSESQIKKDFASPRESESFFLIQFGESKFANQNENYSILLSLLDVTATN